MAIDFLKAAEAVGVGLLDEAGEWYDDKVLQPGKDGSVPDPTETFHRYQDVLRLLMVGGGYGLQVFMPRYSKLGDTLATAATPLLTKTVVASLKAASKPRAAYAASWAPRRQAAPSSAPAANAGRRSYPDVEESVGW